MYPKRLHKPHIPAESHLPAETTLFYTWDVSCRIDVRNPLVETCSVGAISATGSEWKALYVIRSISPPRLVIHCFGLYLVLMAYSLVAFGAYESNYLRLTAYKNVIVFFCDVDEGGDAEVAGGRGGTPIKTTRSLIRSKGVSGHVRSNSDRAGIRCSAMNRLWALKRKFFGPPAFFLAGVLFQFFYVCLPSETVRHERLNVDPT